MIGISEWNYDIPMAFRWLLSARPRTAVSSVWQGSEQVAIVGEYAEGVRRLLAELDKHVEPVLAPLRDEARAFLTDPANQRTYFVLECGDIYLMNDEPNEQQNLSLLREIEALSGPGGTSPSSETSVRKSLFSRLFGGGETPVLRIDWTTYGLGNWSNVLCCDLNELTDEIPVSE